MPKQGKERIREERHRDRESQWNATAGWQMPRVVMEPKIRAATAPDPPECTGIILPPGDEDWACAASVCQAPTTCSLRFSAPTRTGQSHGRRAKPRNASSSSRGQIRTGILSHRPTAPAGAASKPTLQTGLRPSEGSNVGSNTALGADSVPGGGKIRLAREKRVRSVVLSPTEFDDEIRQVRRRIVEEEDSLFTFQSPNCAFICVCVSKLRCLFGDGCCLFPLFTSSPPIPLVLKVWRVGTRSLRSQQRSSRPIALSPFAAIAGMGARLQVACHLWLWWHVPIVGYGWLIDTRRVYVSAARWLGSQSNLSG